MQNPWDMMSAIAASLKKRTGRDLEEWLSLVEKSGLDPLDQLGVRRWLKAEHDISQNSQWAIADAAARAAGWVPPTLDEHIDNQYAGAKAILRPIFEELRAAGLALGEDVSIEGRASYIPLVRGRQFAAVAAATRTRVDLGLRFREAPEADILFKGGPGQSTHKVGLNSVDDITDNVLALLRIAYEQNS